LHVAVAIVAFRNAEDVLGCLAALARSTYRDFEVIVVENGGPEAFTALSKVLPAELAGGQTVRAVEAPSNLGYAGGVNLCIEETPKADAWWVLNPDTEPYADALELQVARLAAGDCDAVGCTIHLPDGRVQSHGGRWNGWLARAVSMGHGSALEPAPDPSAVERLQNYLNGASMLVGRRFVEAAGPMREDYFLYCEEVEWCLRARTKGMRLGYAPGARILHHQGTSTGNAVDIRAKGRMPVYLNERNRLNLTRDRFPMRMPVVALACLAATGGLRSRRLVGRGAKPPRSSAAVSGRRRRRGLMTGRALV
jgi:N-acetylglucosaminyl-diphospho-decaprenol L-rhamnosyltransferase